MNNPNYIRTLRLTTKEIANPYFDKRCKYGIRRNPVIPVGTRLLHTFNNFEIEGKWIQTNDICFTGDAVNVRQNVLNEKTGLNELNPFYTILMENSELESPAMQELISHGMDNLSARKFVGCMEKLQMITVEQVKRVLDELDKE